MGMEATDQGLVFSYPKLDQWLNENPNDRVRAGEILKEIQSDYSPSFHKMIAFAAKTGFKKMYDGLYLDYGEQENVTELMTNYHVVLVPNHQSHADYLAINYLIYKHFNEPVFVAGGINMNIFPIGGLFRKSGAFFLRRSFQNNKLYKNVFEAYIYYLLKQNRLIEFFFEGGRSRTGKLLSPRYGLFSMLLEAHAHIKNAKPLMFVPVSIAHERIPEVKAHIKELGGEKKVAESSGQLLKVFKLANKNLGSIHVRLGKGIIPGEVDDIKRATQTLAFDCFRAVGRGMSVTPTSLLSLVILSEPSGALTWDSIHSRANEILKFCNTFGVPITKSLEEKSEERLKKALSFLLQTGRANTVNKKSMGQVFFTVPHENRVELLYFKNMILHHFLVPYFIVTGLRFVRKGKITSVNDLTRFLLSQRKEFKYEFYLPYPRELIARGLEIISSILGRQVESLEECLTFPDEDREILAEKLKVFANMFVHIYEGYYIVASTIKFLGDEQFTRERFIQVAKEVFDMEKIHGRFIKFPESYTVPTIRNGLSYFTNKKVLKLSDHRYQLAEPEKIDDYIKKFIKDIQVQSLQENKKS